MELSGYMLEVEWDGATLRARGTNKASQVALRGQGRNQGDVVLGRDEIAKATFKDASRMTNGRLDVHSTRGERYQLHFRRKQADSFRKLAVDLGAAGV